MTTSTTTNAMSTRLQLPHPTPQPDAYSYAGEDADQLHIARMTRIANALIGQPPQPIRCAITFHLCVAGTARGIIRSMSERLPGVEFIQTRGGLPRLVDVLLAVGRDSQHGWQGLTRRQHEDVRQAIARGLPVLLRSSKSRIVAAHACTWIYDRRLKLVRYHVPPAAHLRNPVLTATLAAARCRYPALNEQPPPRADAAQLSA